jgi:Flp pilus assembly protein TadD
LKRRRFLPTLAAPLLWSSGQSELRAADLPVQFRKPPEWEKLREQIAPGHDDFPGELRAMEIEQALRSRQPGRYYVLGDGRVRFEQSGKSDKGLYYRVGHLRVDWLDGRLANVEQIDEREVRAERPLFTDVTGELFGGIHSFRDQLTKGIPYWRSRVDVASGINVFGQNGIAAGDIDNDGWDEIYICQPGGLPNRLYKREASGKWTDWTERSKTGILDDTAQALFLDLRNSGRQDLIVLTASQPVLLLNEGEGVFKLAPDAFQFAKQAQGMFSGMAAADYDRDGKLDLYLCTYLYFQSEDQYRYPVPYHDAQNGPPNFLFRNRLKADGSGVFEDATQISGLAESNNRYSFAAAWCDYDNDGWPDLYVANDFGRNNLYKNSGGKFKDVARACGVEDMGPGMSAAWFDSNGDGRPDLYVANMWTAAGQRVTADPSFAPLKSGATKEDYSGHTRGNSLYRQRPDGTFENVALSEDANVGRWAWCADGIDWDLDGVPEILSTCGMISHSPEKDVMSFFWRQVVAKSPAAKQVAPDYEKGWNAINQFIREDYSWNGYEPNVFYRREDDRYIDYSGVSGLDAALDSRAFAVADLDGDGHPDLVLKNRLGPQVMAFRNDSAGGRSPLVIELRGTESNRDAIGAKVELHSGTRRVTQWLIAGSGYLSQHSKRLFFSAREPVSVRVSWPSGKVEEFAHLAPGRRHVLTEGGKVTSTELASHPNSPPSPVAGTNDLVVEPTRLLDPIPLPEKPTRAGPHIVTLTDLSGDRLAIYSLFRRYLFDYRAPLKLPLAFKVNASGLVEEIYPGGKPAPTGPALPFQGFYLMPPGRNFFRLASPFIAAGYSEAALPYLDRAVQQEPSNFKVQLAAGQVALELNRLEDAERYLNAAQKLGDSPELWNNLGGLALAREDYSTAFNHFEHALKLKPEFVEAMVNSGQAAARLGKEALAEERYRTSLAIRPNDADAANYLGLLLVRRRNYEEAGKFFKQAIESQRNHAGAINNLAILYATTGKTNDAIAALRYGIEVAPEYDLLHLNLAKILGESGQREQAKAVLEHLLQLKPGNVEARRILDLLVQRP